jgi:hypothetical protein
MTIDKIILFETSEDLNQTTWRHIINDNNHYCWITKGRPLRYSTTVSNSEIIYRVENVHWRYDKEE